MEPIPQSWQQRGWIDYAAKGRKPTAQETSGEAEGWKIVGRKKAAAVVAKTAAAVAKSEAKAEQAEETEGAVAEARQRRTFLEVVLGGAKAGVSKPAVKA